MGKRVPPKSVRVLRRVDRTVLTDVGALFSQIVWGPQQAIFSANFPSWTNSRPRGGVQIENFDFKNKILRMCGGP